MRCAYLRGTFYNLTCFRGSHLGGWLTTVSLPTHSNDVMDGCSSDRLALPPPEKLREIAAKQEERAKANRVKRAQAARKDVAPGASERSDAAQLIQRNYRGYRERRALQGYGLDPSTRWLEVCISLSRFAYRRVSHRDMSDVSALADLEN